MFKGRGWFPGGISKPKNPHSLEQLKYLYNFLSKNQQVSDNNRGLLVETLRSIAEILIWGDQNDSSVFDFFLEKNMLSFFLKIMKQKSGRYVCVQLLQTLNILFENIRNETSLYYLLSNNHVNSIIVHKFDFSDEEVMAYYISFLKTLSLKLNIHTIHFFYNEHTNDFPLYTEAIKFFNHNESMVRIAVRTLTLNVYKVNDKSMMKFIRDRTAAPYFSNLVWFIGNHIIELDACANFSTDCPSGYNRLSDLVAEHLDHLHYLNDMLRLEIDSINEVLTEHLLHRLFIPLYVYSLSLTNEERQQKKEEGVPHVSAVVSLFLLSQVFLIISHYPLVQHLAHIILDKVSSTSEKSSSCNSSDSQSDDQSTKSCFIAPPEPLEKSLESKCILFAGSTVQEIPVEIDSATDERQSAVNVTDEEKVETAQRQFSEVPSMSCQQDFDLDKRPYLQFIFDALDCAEDDHQALFALCLLYAIGHNDGINQQLLDSVFIPTERSDMKHWYNTCLVEKLIRIIHLTCQHNSKVRLATLEISLLLLKQLVFKSGKSFLQDKHLADLEEAREASTLMLRNFYKSEEIFLDMFEDEYKEIKKKPLNVEYLTMDSSILLAPTGTPMSGVEFHKRLPCGEVERARRAIRVFFLLRDLSLTLRMEPELELPLTNPQAFIQVGDVLDLNNSDLIACTVIMKDGARIRRFLVIDVIQLILVEPDFKKLGWGVAKCVGFLQDLEVSGDKDDSRCLHVTVHKPCGGLSLAIMAASPISATRTVPLLVAKFIFDDHIRCMAAKQRLSKGRLKARQRKMHQIARLLELPGNIQPCPSPPAHVILPLRQMDSHARLQRTYGHPEYAAMRSRSSTNSALQHRPLFKSGAMPKVPGMATVMKKEASSKSDSKANKGSPHSHRSSEKPVSTEEKLEAIPLEDMSNANLKSEISGGNGKKRLENLQKKFTNEDENAITHNSCNELGECVPPKTLRKAEAPPASLVGSDIQCEGGPSYVAPKLVPPNDGDTSLCKPVSSENETSFTEATHIVSNSPVLLSSEAKLNLHMSPVSSPNDVTMMSISVESQSFDPSSDAAMATASITSSTVSSEILDETLDECIMTDSLERYKSKNSGIKTI